MSDEFLTVKISGLDEIQRKMEETKEKLAKRGLRKALRAGGGVFRDAMVQLAPKETGFLSEHFGTKISIRRDALAGSAYVGPRGNIDYPKYSSGAYLLKRIKGRMRKIGRIAVATVARFLEFGTSKMGKKPFMTQAYESNKQKALNTVIDTLKEIFQ